MTTSQDKRRTEVNTGWRSLLTRSIVYKLVQLIFNERGSKEFLLKRYILPCAPRCRLLDMGCGPGNIISYLPEFVDYTGFDVSEEYIEAAKSKFAARRNTTLICGGTKDQVVRNAIPNNSVDLVIVHGVFHHLNDRQSIEMLELARDVLVSGGKMVILEPVWFDGQSKLRRMVMTLDRGKNIKRLEGWEVFCLENTESWANINIEVHSSLIRFYDLMVCTVTAK